MRRPSRYVRLCSCFSEQDEFTDKAIGSSHILAFKEYQSTGKGQVDRLATSKSRPHVQTFASISRLRFFRKPCHLYVWDSCWGASLSQRSYATWCWGAYLWTEGLVDSSAGRNKIHSESGYAQRIGTLTHDEVVAWMRRDDLILGRIFESNSLSPA